MKRRAFLNVAVTGLVAPGIFLEFLKQNSVFASGDAGKNEIAAIYLPSGLMYSETKIAEFLKVLETTDANGIVIDFKDSNVPNVNRFKKLVARFRTVGAYTIARIVTLQDTGFAKKNSGAAIKTKSGDFWYSGRKEWNRYWLDPASRQAQDHNIAVAKMAIDVGFDEIQFDYIRFPTDGKMSDIDYPFSKARFGDNPALAMAEIMSEFFKKINNELKAYLPQAVLAIDVFGEVVAYGWVKGMGQRLSDVSEYFDVICPMAYPSHYRCRSFGLHDPNINPYEVYFQTLKKGLVLLGDKKPIIRPWIQDFSFRNIYDCGPFVSYDKKMVEAQIRAGKDLGINGFMLWNVRGHPTLGVFNKK